MQRTGDFAPTTGGGSPRDRVAAAVARLAVAATRTLRLGRGSVVGGDLALRLSPDILTALTRDRRSVMVTGTNGKTTTSWMTSVALGSQGDVVATNREGSNMAAGLVAALVAAPAHSPAVLEVDEIYLADLARRVHPAAIALMNLSREYTRGVSLSRTAESWKALVSDIDWPCTLVVNADDPLLVAAMANASAAVTFCWVGAGMAWTADARQCPTCHGIIDFSDDDWSCRDCDLIRPTTDWQSLEGRVLGPDGEQPVELGVPAPWLRANALFALALAHEAGIPLGRAAAAVAGVHDVDGRYGLIERGPHRVRIYMVKNPASWQQALSLAGQPGRLILCMDQFGIKDTTSLWDLPLDQATLPRVTVTGHRYADLAARLAASGVEFDVDPDPIAAIDAAPAGDVHLIANYSAMYALRKRLLP